MAPHTKVLSSRLPLVVLLVIMFLPFSGFTADLRVQLEFPPSPVRPAAVVSLTAVADTTILEGSPNLNLAALSCCL